VTEKYIKTLSVCCRSYKDNVSEVKFM